MRSLAIVVSGAPGSGKTTLARALVDAMRLPHLNKDLVMHSLRRGGMEREPANKAAFRIVYGTAAGWLDAGLSFVMDMTLYPGFSEAEIGSLRSHGVVINVHCRAEGALERFEQRMLSDVRNSPRSVAALVEKSRAELADVGGPLALGVPLIEVDATEGYRPALDEVVRWIERVHVDAD